MRLLDWLGASILFRVPWQRLPWILWGVTLAILLWVVHDVTAGGGCGC